MQDLAIVGFDAADEQRHDKHKARTAFPQTSRSLKAPFTWYWTWWEMVTPFSWSSLGA